MNIPAIMSNRITIRPTKRKVIKTVSTMESMAKAAQKENTSADIRMIAKAAAERLGELKHKLAN
jgi:hypothetical protein